LIAHGIGGSEGRKVDNRVKDWFFCFINPGMGTDYKPFVSTRGFYKNYQKVFYTFLGFGKNWDEGYERRDVLKQWFCLLNTGWNKPFVSTWGF
jgi:hypothetical protein